MATTPSDRQLVVYEANPANPNYKRMLAIPPDQATGIPIPTFQVGATRPVAAATQGTAFYETSTREAGVWDGAKWADITPRPRIDQWSATANYAADTLVTDRGMLWVSKRRVGLNVRPTLPSADWKLLGSTGVVKITSICDATDGLASVPQIEGALAFARDTSQLYAYIKDNTGGRWVEQLGGYLGSEVPPALTASNVHFDETETPTWGAVPDLQAAIKKVYTELIAACVPAAPVIGEIKMFASTTIPTGWQLCDGSAIDASKTAAIALFGPNVPDMQDQFVRGWASGKAALLKENYTTGKPAADPHGSASWTVQGTIDGGAHTHLYKSGWGSTAGINGGNYNSGEIGYGGVENTTYGASEHTHTHALTASGQVNIDSGWDAETAPKNIRVVYATYVG